VLEAVICSLTLTPLPTLLAPLRLLAVASLPTLLAARSLLRLAALTLGVALALLPLPTWRLLAFLIALALLATSPLLTRLAASRIAATKPLGEGFHLTAQLLHAVESFFRATLLGTAHSLLSLMQLLPKALKTRTDSGLNGVGVRIHTLANGLRASLKTGLQVGLIHPAQRFMQLRGRCRLAGAEVARCVLHGLLEAGQVIRQKLAFIGELRLLVASAAKPTPTERALRLLSSLVSEHLTHPSGLVLLRARQAIGLARQRIKLAGRLLLLNAVQQVPGFAKPVGSPASVSLALS